MEVEIKMSRKHPSSHNYQDYGKYTLYTTFFSKQNKKNYNNEKKWCQEKQINVQIHKKNPSFLCAASHIRDSWNSGNGGDPLW